MTEAVRLRRILSLVHFNGRQMGSAKITSSLWEDNFNSVQQCFSVHPLAGWRSVYIYEWHQLHIKMKLQNKPTPDRKTEIQQFCWHCFLWSSKFQHCFYSPYNPVEISQNMFTLTTNNSCVIQRSCLLDCGTWLHLKTLRISSHVHTAEVGSTWKEKHKSDQVVDHGALPFLRSVHTG